jgi:hypothetical protein
MLVMRTSKDSTYPIRVFVDLTVTRNTKPILKKH